jgi:hypothetical protein
MLRLVGRSVRRARDGVILKSTTIVEVYSDVEERTTETMTIITRE